jgi:F5/8 type C domain
VNAIVRRTAARQSSILSGRSKSKSTGRMTPFFEPLENRQLLSLVVDIETATGGKTVNVTSVGQVVTLNVVATVTGKNATGTDDGIQSATGSFLSTMLNSGSVKGNLAAQTNFPFRAFGSQFGTQVDLNGDGNIDVGSNDGSTIAGFFNARDGEMDTTDGTVSGASRSISIGTLTYTVTSLGNGGETDINFRRRVVEGLGYAGVWQEDGQIENETTSTFTSGAVLKILGPNSGPTPVQLTGQVIGTTGSWDNLGNTRDKVFDGNLSTFFGSPDANGDWVGLDLGAASQIQQIKYYPRSGYTSRMVGGVFQGSNDSTFNTGVVTLATITTNPSVAWHTITLANPGSYRFVRYLGPDGAHCNIAEMQVWGQPASKPAQQLSGEIIGTPGSWNNLGNTKDKVFDGNLNTFFGSPDANGDWVGLDLGSPDQITQIKYYPRVGYESRMVGGVFRGSNDPSFATGVVTLGTITATPTDAWHTLTVSNTGPYRYVQYVGPNGAHCNIAEMQVWGIPSSTHKLLTGTVIGTAGSFNNLGNTIAKALDGNLNTYFEGPTPNGDWVGIDTGSAHSITQISFAPRSDQPGRMVGGVFQASNSANFSSGVVTLYTVTTAPPAFALTTVAVSTPNTYRYFRYLGPNGGYGDIAEVEFWT